MLPSFCRETVTVARAPLSASRGTAERDWGLVARHEVRGCSVQPTSTSQAVGEPRPGVSVAATLLAPLGADIAAHDRVECSLGSFRVVGAPLAVASPTGALSHVRAQLSREEG